MEAAVHPASSFDGQPCSPTQAGHKQSGQAHHSASNDLQSAPVCSFVCIKHVCIQYYSAAVAAIH